MKKIYLLITFFSIASQYVMGQFLVQATGSTDVCFPNNVTLQVVTPIAGYTYTWFIGGYNCPGASTGSVPYAGGASIQAMITGEFYCLGMPPGGGLPEFSNPVLVRNLPGMPGSIYMPAPGLYSGNANCVSSASLCIPEIYYQNWPGTTIKWYKDNVLINGASSGTYTATTTGYYKYTINNSCSFTSLSDSTLVTTTTPAQITASGSTTICSGSTVVLSANGGVGNSYQWKINGSVIGGAASQNYIAAAAGSYTAVVSNSCGTSTSNAINVIVNPLPTATITPSGNLSFCAGNGIILSANTGAGFSYQWRKNGVDIGFGVGSSYLANSTGNYNVVITNSFGCSKGAASVYVTGPPSNTVSALGPTHFCTGGSVTLKSVSGQPVTYKWKKNGAYISGATSQTYVATSTGSYNCIVTNSFGCSKGGTAIAVTGPPSAVITANGPTTFCTGGSVLLSAQSGYTYQWIKNSANVNGATQQNYSATTAGNYKVKVTDPFGCSKTTPNSNQITVSVPCRDANTKGDVNNIGSVKIYPNPSMENFIIDGEGQTIHSITVSDITGKIVLQLHGLHSPSRLSFGEELAAGLYSVQVTTGDKTSVLKIVKINP